MHKPTNNGLDDFMYREEMDIILNSGRTLNRQIKDLKSLRARSANRTSADFQVDINFEIMTITQELKMIK